jgi:two-component system chemotaxis response regulator CheB
MSKIRLMIVDGDLASRRRIGRALDVDDTLDVVGSSSLGTLALEKVGQLQPDVVILGLSSPGVQGLETLEQLHATRPDLPVFVVGHDARRGSPLLLEAISLGVVGYIVCPDSGITEPLQGELLRKIHELSPLSRRSVLPSRPTRDRPAPGTEAPPELIVIGSSTGGPDCLATVIESLPVDFPTPIVIVQHILEHFTLSLSERLHALRSIPVREAADGEAVRPGTAWLASWGVHVELRREGSVLRIRHSDGPLENSCRPSVDVLFCSAARVVGTRVIGVVLTGMGRDGLRGCRAIREAGGTVLVQDEATSVVWGMPGHVAEAGLAHKILPIGEIGPEIIRRTAGRKPIGR